MNDVLYPDEYFPFCYIWVFFRLSDVRKVAFELKVALHDVVFYVNQ